MLFLFRSIHTRDVMNLRIEILYFKTFFLLEIYKKYRLPERPTFIAMELYKRFESILTASATSWPLRSAQHWL